MIFSIIAFHFNYVYTMQWSYEQLTETLKIINKIQLAKIIFE